VKSQVFDYRITTQLWQGIAILIPILVLNDSANVRTVLYSGNAASCKKSISEAGASYMLVSLYARLLFGM
jgi:hypothetical protein